MVIKLSDKDRKVFTYAQFDTSLSISKIAKESGLKEHTVRYSLKRLKESGFISEVQFLNYSRLGYSYYIVWFSLKAKDNEFRRELVDYLKNSACTFNFVELSGSSEYYISLLVDGHRALTSFFSDVTDNFGLIFSNKSISQVLSRHFYGRRYFHNPTQLIKPIEILEYENEVPIDESDSEILEVLTSNPGCTHSDCARMIGMPISTFLERIKNLKSKGIIERVCYTIMVENNAIKVYRTTSLYKLKSSADTVKERVLKFADESPTVVQIVFLIGEYDLLVATESEDIEQAAITTKNLTSVLGDDVDSFTHDNDQRTVKNTHELIDR